MKIKHISHVAIYGKNMEQLKHLYGTLLGLPVAHEESYQGIADICFLSVGDAEIEVATPTLPGNEFDKEVDKEGIGINHIAFEVEDLDRAIQEMKEKELLALDAEPIAGAQGSRVVFLDSEKTGNVSIELVESYQENVSISENH